MDGYCQNKTKFMISLKTWIDEVINGERWNNFSDLHIDEVDSKFTDKTTWIKSSLSLFDDLINLIDKSVYDAFLVIPLSSLSHPSDLSTKQLDDLEDELDITPPSFYLFKKGDKNFENTLESAIYLGRMSENTKFKVYYKEEKQGCEYYRTLYLRSYENDL